MKAHLASHLIVPVLVSISAIPAASAVAASLTETLPAPNATLNVTMPPGGGGARFKISEAGDRLWILQTSPDFTNWTDTSAVRIYNGSFQRGFPGGTGMPKMFLRA